MIETRRFRLKSITKEDAWHLLNMMKDINIKKYFPIKKLTDEKIEELINIVISDMKSNTRKKYFLKIESKDNNRFMGIVNLEVCSNYACGVLGYSICEEFRNKGIATEAVKNLISYGFNYLKLHRIEASIILSNTSSEKVLLNNNMIYEGMKRQSLYIDNQWFDEKMFGLLKNDLDLLT